MGGVTSARFESVRIVLGAAGARSRKRRRRVYRIGLWVGGAGCRGAGFGDWGSLAGSRKEAKKQRRGERQRTGVAGDGGGC